MLLKIDNVGQEWADLAVTLMAECVLFIISFAIGNWSGYRPIILSNPTEGRIGLSQAGYF